MERCRDQCGFGFDRPDRPRKWNSARPARYAGVNHGGFDFLGDTGGVAGQFADFVGHHAESAPRLTGPGCLNRGIQGQQVGLFGDTGNQAGLAGHGLNPLGQVADFFLVGLQPILELADQMAGRGRTFGHFLFQISRMGAGLLQIIHQLAGRSGQITDPVNDLMGGPFGVFDDTIQLRMQGRVEACNGTDEAFLVAGGADGLCLECVLFVQAGCQPGQTLAETEHRHPEQQGRQHDKTGFAQFLRVSAGFQPANEKNRLRTEQQKGQQDTHPQC